MGVFTTLGFAVLILGGFSLCESYNVQEPYVNNFRIEADIGKDDNVQPSYTVEKPDFCHSLDCPDYAVVKKTKDYEERSYAPSGWVSTHLQGVDYDDASRMMFMRLFRYIQGNNVKKEEIKMTAPVIVSVIPGPGPACKSNFTMSFFVSPSADAPPAPLDKDVFLSSLPAQKVFVRSFGGFAKKDEWLNNALALGEALTKDSQSFRSNLFYSAGYDSPFRLFYRHNEVWFIAE